MPQTINVLHEAGTVTLLDLYLQYSNTFLRVSGVRKSQSCSSRPTKS